MSFLDNLQSSADNAAEFEKVFGVETDPALHAYKQNLLDIIKTHSTHDQIMAGQYLMPKGYSVANEVALVVRACAAVIAYIPVFGTAAAFILNVATSIAQGEDVSDILLDGVRGALPGQPMSSAAFDVIRAAAQGKPWDELAINAIPYLDEDTKKYIVIGTNIVKSIANGERIDNIALQQIHDQLPPDGQEAMNLAQRVLNGENVGDIAMSEAANYAKSQGQDAVNNFIANAGYQGMVKTLPEGINAALTAGNAIGYAQKLQDTAGTLVQISKTVGRIDTLPENDVWAKKGIVIAQIDSLTWHGRNMKTWAPQKETNPEWVRGYDIGTAVSRGKSLAGPGQDAVLKTMKSVSEYNGFIAARNLQYNITTTEAEMAATKSVGRTIFNTAAQEATNLAYAKKGQQIAALNPIVSTSRLLNADPGWRRGFDIGTAMSIGQSQNGPGKDLVRLTLDNQRAPGPGAGPGATSGGSDLTAAGFDTALALQFALTAQGNKVISPDNLVNAGNLIVSGIPNSGLSVDQKTNAATAAVSNPASKAGAVVAINANEGFFKKVLKFFGLAA